MPKGKGEEKAKDQNEKILTHAHIQTWSSTTFYTANILPSHFQRFFSQSPMPRTHSWQHTCF